MQRAIRATIPVAALFFVGLATLAAPTTRAAAAGTVRRPPPAAQPPPANPAWTASRAPLPSGGHRAALFTVVCPAATSCVAAGNFWDSGGLEHGLLETRQGSTWTPSAAPRPAGSGSGLPLSLDGVACPSATACVAAGGYQDSAGTGHGLLVTGHASAWAAGRTPVPGNAATAPGAAYSALSEVACASAASCVAIGGYTDTADDQQGLLVSGHASAWTADEAPLPSGAATGALAGPTLGNVACPAAASCVAIGAYTDASGNQQGLLLTGYRSAWTPSKAPLPSGAAANAGPALGAVACISPTNCVVTGTYTNSAGDPEGLLLTGHGSAWTASKAPLPSGATTAALVSVACPVAASCVATGDSGNSAGLGRGLLLAEHGATWTPSTAPLPAGADPSVPFGLGVVACSSTTSCVATGGYEDTSGKTQGLLLTRTGSTWAARKAPVPAGSGTNPAPALPGLACPTTTSCTVVGYYTDSAGNRQALLLIQPG